MRIGSFARLSRPERFCMPTSPVKQWIRKAESDWTLVQQIQQNTPALNDQICFHCQQAAEKYLKAVLQQFGLPIPRTHNLETLLQHVLPHDSTLRSLRT